MDRVVSFPHLGYYYIVFNYFLSNACRCKVVVPPLSTKKTIELGSKYSPDFVCVPFKYNLGNLKNVVIDTSVVNIRYMENGNYFYLLIFIGAWVCDTFAYFTGRFLGKHKLIPAISPKKTIEGAIGGIIFTMGAFALYGFILRSAFDFEMSYIELIIMGLVVAIVSQIGDLVASAVKRQYEIKDYGFLFPGHGGVLDRFDSVMLVSPFLFILLSVLSLF